MAFAREEAERSRRHELEAMQVLMQQYRGYPPHSCQQMPSNSAEHRNHSMMQFLNDGPRSFSRSSGQHEDSANKEHYKM